MKEKAFYVTFTVSDDAYGYPTAEVHYEYRQPEGLQSLRESYWSISEQYYEYEEGDEGEEPNYSIFDEGGYYNVYLKTYKIVGISSTSDIESLARDVVDNNFGDNEADVSREFVELLEEEGAIVTVFNYEDIGGILFLEGKMDTLTNEQIIEMYLETNGEDNRVKEEMVKRGMDFKSIDAMLRIKRRMK